MGGSRSKHRVAVVASAGLGLVLGSVALPATMAAGASGQAATVWTIQPSPNVTGATASSLAAVSCRASGSCMAVGSYDEGPNNDQYVLVERRHGTTWSIVPTPAIADVDYSMLSDVSCVSHASCTAVGYTASSHSNTIVRALVEQWDGSVWTIQPTPLPVRATWEVLAAVSCPDLHDCIAVGGYIKNQVTSEEQPLAERWNGSSWSVLAAPNPKAENGSSFTGIDCLGADNCEVVGEYDYADVAQSVIAYHYDGTGWTAQEQVNPVGQEFNSDNSVSCTGADACTSVGFWTNDYPVGLAEYWNGTLWARQPLPHPAHVVTDELNGVSCVGGMACTAVGESADNGDDSSSSTLADEWNGTSWQLVPTPNPPGTGSTLNGVSCTTATTCVAVGASYTTSAGATLVETSSG
jgi:hypothetical protein